MSPVQRFVRLLNVFVSDQQFGPADSWIHSTSIVGPDHGLNPSLVQNALRDLGICRRTLHLWVKELNPTAKAMPQTPAQLQGQLRSARAELQSLRNQCEILKKTLAILSNPPSAAKE